MSKTETSYVKALRADIRRWTAERDEYISRAGGMETTQSERCQAFVDEAQHELDRLAEVARLKRVLGRV